MNTCTEPKLTVLCCVCEAILERGDPDGEVSHGICCQCVLDKYGPRMAAHLATLSLISPHEDPARRRVVEEYLAGLGSDPTLTIWTREDDPALWVRAATDDGIEVVRCEVLARDGAGNWYALSAIRLEQRTFSAAEVLTTSTGEA